MNLNNERADLLKKPQMSGTYSWLPKKFYAKLFEIVAIIGSLALSLAFASQTDCPEHFVVGQAPDLINQKLSTNKTQEV